MSIAGTILLVDDETKIRELLTRALCEEGHEVVQTSSAHEARQLLGRRFFDLLIVDNLMPDMTGLDLIRNLTDTVPESERPQILMMTAHATVESAIAAMKLGALDYLQKPFDIDELLVVVTRALEHQRLRTQHGYLIAERDEEFNHYGIAGRSRLMQEVIRTAGLVAQTKSTVLISGETGTGKELVARAIHARSAERDRPLIKVNCAAIPETVLESELFGHVKGAFTGALAQKRGLFEAANGGTLFLDEIGDVPLPTQVRLLRALQEGEIKRVGANESIPVDVRVITATHVNLEEARKQGRFRDDLYFRLNVIPITLPSLRDRPEDVPLLAGHFLTRFTSRMGRRLSGFSPEALAALTRYSWPGNVRELENVVERAVVLCPGPLVELENLPAEIRDARKPAALDVAFLRLTEMAFAQAKALSVAAFERRYLSTLLERTGGNISQAALAAGMDRSNFKRLLREHELTAAGEGGAGETGS